MRKDSNMKVMARMSLEVKPLLGYMVLAVLLGVTGFLCAIFIPYFGALLISHIAIQAPDFPVSIFFIIILVLAVLRGILHYGEQACNHFIAFKLLAIIRDKVFKVLRRLCPAKLEGRDKGDLIYTITSDIEALEVFYAHTISPVLIAIVTSGILLVMFAGLHIIFFIIAFCAYITCGILIPFYITHIGKQKGINRRDTFGDLSNYTLESLRGMQEVLQYNIGEQRLSTMHKKSVELNDVQESLKTYEAISSSLSMVAVTIFSLLVFIVGCSLYLDNAVSFTTLLMATVLMLSSFGPVLALSNLSNNLLITMASARRVLHLLDEEALVSDIDGCEKAMFGDINVQDVSFAYAQEDILTSFNATFEKGKITGILGKSGSGKSTLLKLIMRFWIIQKGKIQFQNTPIDQINTKDLRDLQSFVTQDTTLFHDSIFNNIRVAKLNATMHEVIEACKKASIHDFISSLPKGYETPVEELGASLSGGEKQRIGIARAFLHDSPCILLDEPTSNLDALNEAVILKSIREQKDKTVLLVSHRPSTMKIADAVICVENGRVS